MATALLAVVASYGSLMRLLSDKVWLAHDNWPGSGLFGKQEYPVIVVPPEVTGDPAGQLGTAIGVFTTTDWGHELPKSVRVDGRRYTHAQPVRVTRLTPAGEGVEVILHMVNRYALRGGDGEPARLKRLSVAVEMDTYTGLKEALRRITRPLATVLPGYLALADRQAADHWLDAVQPLELELPRTTVYGLVRSAVDEHARRRANWWHPWASRRQRDAKLPDDHNVALRIALGYLYEHAVNQVPDAPPARILATIADAYPAFADECERQIAIHRATGRQEGGA